MDQPTVVHQDTRPPAYNKGGGEFVYLEPGDWPKPRTLVWDDALWEERPSTKDWIYLGWAPEPTTRVGWFRYHYHHGRLMGFPLWATLKFSIRCGILR